MTAKIYFCSMKRWYLLILLIAALAIFLSVSSANRTDSAFQNSKEEILFRKIGHELLNSSGDSTSRVMPIKHLSENEFQIRFENQHSFVPDSIVNIVKRVLTGSTLPGDYSVNVLDCSTREIVYGFVISGSDRKDVTPCLERSLARSCYYIDLKFSTIDSISPLYLTGIAILGVGLIFWGVFNYYKRRQKKDIFEKNTNQNSSKSIQIGKYVFYFELNCIEFENEKTLLTSKESKLLYIFSSSPNEIIDRNRLQKEVWEDEGVIVTRSLDMFVSKLRKKLAKDPFVKIVNIHGKGYKLEVVI